MRGLDLRFKTGEVDGCEVVELLPCLERLLERASLPGGGSLGRRKIGEASVGGAILLSLEAACSSGGGKTVGVRVRQVGARALASPRILGLTSLPRRRSEMCCKTVEATVLAFGRAPAPLLSKLTPLPRRRSEKRCRKVEPRLPGSAPSLPGVVRR